MTSYDDFYSEIKHNWDTIAKPLDSLGKLEELTAKIGAIQKNISPGINKSAVLVLCSDNGIIEEGVSQSTSKETLTCAENIALYKTTVGIMAKNVNCNVIAVDIGMASSNVSKNILNKKIRNGTRNFLKEPAMTEDEVHSAVKTGTDLVKECKEKGFEILCIGEMGIGNTTTSSAVAAAVLKEKAESVTGRGAGLSDEGLQKKISVIQKAIEKYDLYRKTPLEILQYVGGYDIAGMVGVYLGAEKYGIPVVLDGSISLVAALVASSLKSNITRYLIPSHKSREPLTKKVLQKLELEPVIDADMALGEGTGAVLMLGILKTACDVYKKSIRFEKSGVEQYKRF